jgi:hypothetical protein
MIVAAAFLFHPRGKLPEQNRLKKPTSPATPGSSIRQLRFLIIRMTSIPLMAA